MMSGTPDGSTMSRANTGACMMSSGAASSSQLLYDVWPFVLWPTGSCVEWYTGTSTMSGAMVSGTTGAPVMISGGPARLHGRPPDV